MSWRSATNLSTVAMRLTTTAANSSYTLCTAGLSMSPMKNPKFNVAASRTKKPNTTFSRFIGPPSPHRHGSRRALTLLPTTADADDTRDHDPVRATEQPGKNAQRL